MSEVYCQSCGMPMSHEGAVYGTNEEGSLSKDYCSYCYQDGAFTADVTMEGMIDICLPHMVKAGNGLTEDAARNMMNEFFPSLKRWRK